MRANEQTSSRRIGQGARLCIVLAAIVLVGGLASIVARRQRPAVTGAARSRPAPETSVQRYVPPSAAGFVGSRICAECHSEIAATYARHPMAHSTSPIETSSIEATASLKQRRVGGERRSFHVEVRSGAMWHHETMRDASGEVLYDQAVSMDFEIGSGRRAKAYVHRRGELLFMSPLNWYTQAQKWDFAPGYSEEDPRRFDRRITDDCLGCHAGRIATRGRSSNRYATPAFHEMGIGCERCHGPGQRHVELHASGTGDPAADPIVNPAELDPERRESVCYQCHLQSAARVPRFQRSHLDFRPGDRLSDIWTDLVADSGVAEDGSTRSVSHVQQMRESRCFVESSGRFGCISCHDPHRVPEPEERIDFYRQRCLECHSDGACTAPSEHRRRQENSCIACHMPKRDSSNMSHVTQTDHRVLRSYQAASNGSEPTAETPLRFFASAEDALLEWEKKRALGLGGLMYLRKTGQQPPSELARLLLDVLEVVPNDGTVLTALGSMAMDQNRIEAARRHYERARSIPGAREDALAVLLKIHYLSADWNEALQCADELLAIDPGNAGAHAMRADTLKMLGRLPEAIEAAEKALEFNPTLVPVRAWLEDAYRQAGDLERAQQQAAILRRMPQTGR